MTPIRGKRGMKETHQTVDGKLPRARAGLFCNFKVSCT